MHPFLLQRRAIALYLIVWVGIAKLLTGVLILAQPRPLLSAIAYALPLMLAYAFVCLSAWWVVRARPATASDFVSRTVAIMGAALVSALLLTMAAVAWHQILETQRGVALDPTMRLKDVIVVGTAGLVLYLQSVVLHDALLAVEGTRIAERHALQSQVSAREAELRALRAQLNPHFLFNSLNSINALVGSDPEGARRMCESLGEFLRQTLRLGGLDAVPLAEELALVDRYLAIEHVRFGTRLAVERDVTLEAARCLVPPLLLQPVVENAVKHGIAARIEGGLVRLTATQVDGTLRVAVENGVDADDAPQPGTGYGLENVRRRLAAAAGDGARLDVARDAAQFRVTLTLPARVAAAVAS